MLEANKAFAFLEFVEESDEEFYEKYLTNLTEEELERFLKETPEFSL